MFEKIEGRRDQAEVPLRPFALFFACFRLRDLAIRSASSSASKVTSANPSAAENADVSASISPFAIADEISGEFGHGYISYGQYYDQVKRYYDVFGKEAILLFWDKDLFKLDPNELILILAGFLGVEPWKLPIGIDKNEKRIAKHWVIRRMLGLSKLRVVVRALLPKKLQGLLKSQMYRKRLTVEEEADRDKGMSMLDGVFDEDLNKLERFLNEI